MYTQAKLGVFALCLTSVGACQHGRRQPHPLSVKRHAIPLTPLTPEETTLVDSVSTTTLDQWSYYYTRKYIMRFFLMVLKEYFGFQIPRWSYYQAYLVI
jgi:hypothetical protein